MIKNYKLKLSLQNGKVNVIHRLKDGKNFGLIEPEA